MAPYSQFVMDQSMDPNGPVDCDSSRIEKLMSAGMADESKSRVRQPGLEKAKNKSPGNPRAPDAAERRWMKNTRLRETAKHLMPCNSHPPMKGPSKPAWKAAEEAHSWLPTPIYRLMDAARRQVGYARRHSDDPALPPCNPDD
jgi:hypothetical protein